MEIWLDTCNIESIREVIPLGIIQGITTNPTIVRGHDLSILIPALLEVQPYPVAVQVTSGSSDAMLAQALAFKMLSERILPKVPTHGEGLKCMQGLAEKGVPFLATAIFTPLQALLAFKAGAAYLAPYVGRIEDEGIDGFDTLTTMQWLQDSYRFRGKILAASLRTKESVERCLQLGIEAVTVRPALFDQLIEAPAGLVKALQEWKV